MSILRSSMGVWVAGVGLALAASFSVAAAQTEGEAAPPEPPAADLTAQRDVQLTPAQMEARLNEYLPRMEQGAATVRQQLSQARSARDVVKVLCLNDKLNQIDVAIRSANDRAASLRLALSRNDVDRARHEFQVVSVLSDRVRDLVAEANQCIGEETGFIGESRIVVEIDPTIPEDTTEIPPEDTIFIPPTTSSPIQ